MFTWPVAGIVRGRGRRERSCPPAGRPSYSSARESLAWRRHRWVFCKRGPFSVVAGYFYDFSGLQATILVNK